MNQLAATWAQGLWAWTHGSKAQVGPGPKWVTTVTAATPEEFSEPGQPLPVSCLIPIWVSYLGAYQRG